MNDIDPTAIIGNNVSLGKRNKILPYTIIYGPTVIGDDNIIGPNVVIGTPGEDTKNPRYNSDECVIRIGNRNIIREFTAIQKPCYEKITSISDDVFLMHGVHIPHDAELEKRVVITPLCVLGGITKILEAANVGMGAKLNQRCVIGQYSIVAAGSTVMKNVRPFSRYIPNKPISVNTYALKKYNLTEYEEEITQYVLNGLHPRSPVLVELIDHFNDLHDNSNLKLY